MGRRDIHGLFSMKRMVVLNLLLQFQSEAGNEATV
jgi:hypothetical protein